MQHALRRQQRCEPVAFKMGKKPQPATGGCRFNIPLERDQEPPSDSRAICWRETLAKGYLKAGDPVWWSKGGVLEECFVRQEALEDTVGLYKLTL